MEDPQNVKVDLDSNLKNGPVRDRSCTDIICCLAFVAYTVTASMIVVKSFSNGDLTKIARPMDGDGSQMLT